MIVWVWTLTATLGALIAAWNTLDAWADLRALGRDINGRRMLALGWVRREVIRLFIQSVWALIGVAAIQAGQASGEPTLFTYLLVATNVAVALNTILDARDRIALRRIVG